MSEQFKTSWDYIKEANKKSSTKFYYTKDKEYWWSYPTGRKWKQIGDGDCWWIRTKTGREKLEDDDLLLQPATPIFCPKCKRIMKRSDDIRSFNLRNHCFLCDIEIHAINGDRPNRDVVLEKIKELEKENNKK